MKKILISIVTIIFIAPLSVFAIEGACSSHGGANCGIGPINGRAVCNDNWLSSVSYYSMNECIGYGTSCTSYLNEAQYFSNKNTLKGELSVLQTQIDKLKSDLNSLDYAEAQALVDLNESFRGRMTTTGGAQPQINAVHRDYAQRKLNLSQEIDTTIGQYNDTVQKYNSICQNYSYEQKNNVCTKNLGSEYKYSGESLSCTAPIIAPTPTCSDGYVLDSNNLCITYTQGCQNANHNDSNIIGSKGVDGKTNCNCTSNYSWNGSQCIVNTPTAVDTKKPILETLKKEPVIEIPKQEIRKQIAIKSMTAPALLTEHIASSTPTTTPAKTDTPKTPIKKHWYQYLNPFSWFK